VTRTLAFAGVGIAVVAATGCHGPSRFFAPETVCAQLRAHGFQIETRPPGLDYVQIVPRGSGETGPVPYLINIYEEDPEHRPSESADALSISTDAEIVDGSLQERYWNVVLSADADTPGLARLDVALETLDEAEELQATPC